MNIFFKKLRTWKERLEIVKISRSIVSVLIFLTLIGTITEMIGLSLFLPIFQFLRMDGDINALVNESSLWNYAINGFQYFELEVSLEALLILSF